MSTSTTNRKEVKEQERNWLDLPFDVTTNILKRIGMVDILENAQKVCTGWRKICKDPVLWKVVSLDILRRSTKDLSTAKIICKHAIDRSQDQLVDLTLIYDYDGDVFLYAADRSSQLRRLEMVSCLNNGISLTTDALMKFPLLEELSLYSTEISQEEIVTVGRYCPMLKTLKVNKKLPTFWLRFKDDKYENLKAIAIGQNLPELRHLELIANPLTSIGLQVILDNCHHLETLDLRACLSIDLNGDLSKKCFEQIKHLKLPTDSLDGCPYFYEIFSDSTDDDSYDPFDSAEQYDY